MDDKELTIIVKLRDEAKAALQSLGNEVDKVASNIRGGWDSSVAASTKFAAGLAVAGTAAIGFGFASVKSFMDSQNAAAQLDAVLTSTAGAAGVTRDAALDLASGLQAVTTFSDEAVLGAENILLTFTGISKDVFPQTTELALDMAQALGMDASQAAMQLGKALNDPRDGLTKLTKQGVTFTEEQKKQVEAMTEAGDVMGAQKIILAELAKEFGGSARAAAQTFGGQLKQVWNIIDDGMETIGGLIAGAIKPAVQAFLDWASAGGVSDMINDLINNVDKLRPLLPVIAGAIVGGLVPAFIALGKSIWLAMSPLNKWLAAGALIGVLVDQLASKMGGWGGIWKALGGIVQGVVSIWNGIKPALELAWKAIETIWNVMVALLVPVLKQLWEAIQPLLPLLKWIAIIFGTIIVAAIVIFIAIIAAVVVVITTVVTAIVTVVNWLYQIWTTIWYYIGEIITTVWTSITTTINTAISAISAVINAVLGAISAAWNAVWGAISAVATAVWEGIKTVISTAVNLVKQYITNAVNNILAVWNGIKNMASAVAETFSNVVNAVANGISNAYNKVKEWVGNFVQAGKDIITGVVNGISNAAGQVKDKIIEIAKGALDAVKKFFGIGSPSKVMAEQGRWMMIGLANGIKESAAIVEQAMIDSMPNPTIALDSIAPTVSAVSSGKVGGGGSSTTDNSRSVVIYQTNEINQDIDMEAYNRALGLRLASL